MAQSRSQSRGPRRHGANGEKGSGGRMCGGPVEGNGHAGVPVLTYFDGEGLAEQVRLVFQLGGVKFVDRRIKSHDEFEAKFRQYTPHGQVPILEVNGEIIVQSSAIMAFAARRAGLAPESSTDRDRARSIQSMLAELTGQGDAVSAKAPVQERRGAILARMSAMLPTTCARVEASINPSANGWLFADSLSYADVMLYTSVRSWKMFVPEATADFAAKYPKIQSVHDAVANHPAVKKYTAAKNPFKPRLYYRNFDGLAAPTRWAFEIGGVEYENVYITDETWPELKAKIPAGTMPALEVAEGEFLSESVATLIHAAGKSGLVPAKDTHYAHAYSVAMTIVPISAILKTLYAGVDEEQKAKNLKIVNEETLPALFKRLEGIVGLKQSKQGYVVGDKLSFADLLVANILNLISARLMGIHVDGLWTNYPNCAKVHQIVVSHPVIADYLLRNPVVTPKLVYGDIAGRAEAIRQLFKYGNVEFEDHRFEWDQWKDGLKAESLTGKCPYLDIGTDRIYETLGCVMYAAERAHLLPRTWKARSQAMALYSVYNNVVEVRSRPYAAPEGAERDALREANKPDFETQFAIVEKLLAVSQSTEGYAVGNELSWIDFYIAYETDFVIGAAGWLAESWAEKFPHVAKLHKLVLELRK